MLGNAGISRYIPFIWEFSRALPGVVAMTVLVAIVFDTTSLAQQDGQAPAGGITVAARAPSAEGLPRAQVSWRPEVETLVFYLVATPQEEYLAVWNENFGALEAINAGVAASRRYTILYGRTADEERSAAQIILDRVVSRGGVPVEVNDLRGGNIGP